MRPRERENRPSGEALDVWMPHLTGDSKRFRMILHQGAKLRFHAGLRALEVSRGGALPPTRSTAAHEPVRRNLRVRYG